MSTKVSKTAIGAFVLGAIALLVAGVLVLGAGKLFKSEHTYITYFDGSVKGLSAGSPVMFRGVKIGSVTDIGIVVDPSRTKLKIPVIFTLEPAKIRGTRAEFQRDPKFIENAVKIMGLRTQLQSMSFVTGQLVVSLDFFPEKPANFIGLNKEYPEIPSVPTPLEEMQKTVENLPLRQIVENLNSTVAGINELVKSVDAKKTTQSVQELIRDVQNLVQQVNEKMLPLADSLTKTSSAAEATLHETRETMAATRGNIGNLVASTQSTLESAKSALQQSEHTLRSYSGDSTLQAELHKTLRDLTKTSRSFRELSDYLERHPEALLRGKEEVKGD